VNVHRVSAVVRASVRMFLRDRPAFFFTFAFPIMFMVLFGLIFVAAIMIDVAFKPVGGQLMRLIGEGSSDATELPLRATMDGTRRWVFAVYALLFATSYLGLIKPF